MFDDSLFDDVGLSQPQYTLQDALNALPIDVNSIVPPQIIYGFSDLDPMQIHEVQAVWQNLPDAQRTVIMERLAEVTEADYTLDYSMFATLGYGDPTQAVRVAAIRAGWADENPATLHTLMDIAQRDSSVEVRAAAISQVGQFIYLGEMEEFNQAESAQAIELALAILNDPAEPLDVQRRALEAVAHSSHPDVEMLIEDAYQHDDLMMRISAVHAMGNSCDEERWGSIIDEELDSSVEEMCFEAIHAAGAVGLRSSVAKLNELSYSTDSQIQEAAIWALGEIGGEEAIAALSQLQYYAESAGNDDLQEAIEDALTMASVMSDLDFPFDMMNFDLNDDDDEEDH